MPLSNNSAIGRNSPNFSVNGARDPTGHAGHFSIAGCGLHETLRQAFLLM